MAMTWLLGRSGAVPRLGIGSRHKLLLGTGLLILLVFLFNLVNIWKTTNKFAHVYVQYL